MDIEKISQKIKNNERRYIEDVRLTSLMIPLIEEDGEKYILFEKRAKGIKQPGDISFPGGHYEKGEDLENTAIRETIEELNLKRENINVLGKFGDIFTATRLFSRVYVCEIHNIKIDEISPDEAEVEEIISVSIRELMEKIPLEHKMEFTHISDGPFPYHLIAEGKNYKFAKAVKTEYFYVFDNFTIWGYTARILRAFLDFLRDDI